MTVKNSRIVQMSSSHALNPVQPRSWAATAASSATADEYADALIQRTTRVRLTCRSRYAPQTGPLKIHGTQSCGHSAAQSVSPPRTASVAIQMVPVITLRRGTGHDFQPSLLAIIGPSFASN